MAENQIIINVGRQVGCGGRLVARRLADMFQAAFYDQELLNLAAQESGFSPEFFRKNDENKGFLKTLFHLHTPHMSDSNMYVNRFSQEGLFQFQSDAIRKAAGKGNCVFVGRCADYVLRDNPHCLNVFLTASLEDRIARVVERQKYTEEQARRFITQKEKERAAYYNFYTGRQWGHASCYDLCVNTSLLGIEGAAELIRQAVGGNN